MEHLRPMAPAAAFAEHPGVTEPTDLAATLTRELLRLYGGILTELRARDIVRSENSPVGDYAEHLCAVAFGLRLENNSSIGWDGIDAEGVRYQVKGRRLTSWSSSRQLGAIRGLAEGLPAPFDVLVGVLFDADMAVMKAALLPIDVVRGRASLSKHVNGWRFMLTDNVWSLEGVRDVTEEIRAAETKL